MPSTEHTVAAGGPGVAQLYALDKTAVPWVAGSLIKTFRTTNQTQFAVDTNRQWTVTPANEEDTEALQTVFRNALHGGTTTAGTMAARVRENGTPVGGGVSGGIDQLLLVGGPIGNEDDDDVRILTIACVNIDPTSGGWIQQANNPTAPSLIFKSVSNSEDISVTETIINAMPDADGNASALYLRAAGAETLDAKMGLDKYWITAA